MAGRRCNGSDRSVARGFNASNRRRSSLTTFSGYDSQHPNTILLNVLNEGGSDALDWEAPEPYCAPLDKIVTLINGQTSWLDLGSPVLECEGLVGDPQQQQNLALNDPWLEFVVSSTSLPPEDLIANEGVISVQDVLDQQGNITRAVAAALVSNQTFIDGIHHVEVPISGVVGSCAEHESPYESPFAAVVTGTSIAGSGSVGDNDQLTLEICFDPLLGVLAEVATS